MKHHRREIVIVGSGFAATILARALNKQGRDVLVVERGRHPRFALGESSTPLAALSLERLAARYDLPDLAALGSWGRLRRELPHIRCGLKRGFTFWFHRQGEPWHPGEDNVNRLLVAASPDDEIADVHWMRGDVDHHLVQKAREEGVEIWERVELTGAEETESGMRLTGRSDEGELVLDAPFVVDASGPAGFLARTLPIPRRPRQSWSPPSTTLIFSHFDGVAPLTEALADGVAESLEPGPYPDELAAVHHILDGGWMYGLRFASPGSAPGALSAGAVLDPRGLLGGIARQAVADVDPASAWQALLDRYPTLNRHLATAQPTRPLASVADLPYRLTRSNGRHWALLPHTFAFFDPMFSTGIAWSLLAVERLAQTLAEPEIAEDALARSAKLLADEADHIERLIALAWRTLSSPHRLAAVTFLYFAAASWNEIRQRLFPQAEAWEWSGFLGAEDPTLVSALREAGGHLEDDPEGLPRWSAAAISSRNLAGLADRSRRNLYPVEESALLDACDLLKLSPGELRPLLPRLRGETADAASRTVRIPAGSLLAPSTLP